MPYTLLVDETGTDSRSKKIIFVGCLVEDTQITDIENRITAFNNEALSQPSYSNKRGWVFRSGEARHFVADHHTLREMFVIKVLTQINCRVYASMMSFGDKPIEDAKVLLLGDLIEKCEATKRVGSLTVIAEQSERTFESKFTNVRFESKDFLPLSIADYYAGMLHAFHDLRIKLANGEEISQKDSSFDIRFYETMQNRIALEHDLSTKEISSRRDGRIFYDQFSKLYTRNG